MHILHFFQLGHAAMIQRKIFERTAAYFPTFGTNGLAGNTHSGKHQKWRMYTFSKLKEVQFLQNAEYTNSFKQRMCRPPIFLTKTQRRKEFGKIAVVAWTPVTIPLRPPRQANNPTYAQVSRQNALRQVAEMDESDQDSDNGNHNNSQAEPRTLVDTVEYLSTQLSSAGLDCVVWRHCGEILSLTLD